jgi:arylsulfatase A-like enzyme
MPRRIRNPLPTAILVLAAVTSALAKAPPIVVIVMMDGARADGAGCIATGPHVAPTVRRLCAGGVAFSRAYAQSSWAAASVASILTGVLPSLHGVNAGDDALPADRPTIATALADAGYVTAAFTSEPDDMTRGLLRGYSQSLLLPMNDIPGYRFDPAERMALTMLDWVNDHRRDLATKGVLLLMHMAPARFGYFPPAEYLRRFVPATDFARIELLERRANQFEFRFGPKSLEKLVAASEAGIALADGALALVLAELRAPELASRLWIVMLSSYGEARMEHGLVGHGITLYDESIRVPLVIVPPLGRGGGTRLEHVVELADVMPTILDVAGVTAPADLRGRSLLPAVDGSRLVPREAVSELVQPNPLRVHAQARIHPNLQKTFQRQDGGAERYDLATDPGERTNLGH